ncbi:MULTISPECIES: hypothetical protein [unclassified Streptomyces]|uniref:hypothetical protein n=1 Tax=unclassified Streptomyces TaxID=2593676 RepID=UPI002E286297|nr:MULTISPECIES: hypothetical protein [unclassified Streptomyces]WUB89046.1 hypothetical protein OG812_21700 [Streptomyces sp. NBC_00566]
MRVTSAVLVGAVMLTLAGCGAGGEDGAEKVPATATGSLESLAAEVRCRPDMQTDADEIRQALCKNADGKFVLATFATDRGQREWINDAKDYGGHYLVGRKWVAVGDDGVVDALRETLGGDVEVGADHSGHGAKHGG